ncbi:MAG: tRNA (adenosine(37)-N6)-threonylcarbamoyltransferase complex transferase subunit TsaD, partial [Patescibacteria group bacterium]
MAKKTFKILGIETSCDETAASILKIENCKLKIITNIVSSQVKIHAQYGGIVPELAARKHAENIIPVLKSALNSKQKIKNYIDAIAVTNGPGLITSLLVGVEAAKTLAFLANKPLVPVNHLAGHIYANFIKNCKLKIENLFPAICLVVSGGHTELILMKDFEKFQKIGQTLDDAAGECFDKVAKILGLSYPGGPAIANCARQWKSKIQNSKLKIELPRPMINSSDFNFSFSGLKTAVLYKVKDLKSKIK